MPITRGSASPLRYPGSKASLVNYIACLLGQESLSGCTLIEPYAGSAVVSLELLRDNTIESAVIVERDPLLFAFWNCVFNETEALLRKLHDTPVTLDTWKSLLHLRSVNDAAEANIVDLGFAGLFYNRTNFSGILKANPLGGMNQTSQYKIDCRFNTARLATQIEQLSLLSKRVSVFFGDGLEWSKKLLIHYQGKKLFMYIDPPYFIQGSNLYRYWFKYQDHVDLAEWLLNQEVPWLVSYDYHEKIIQLYCEQHRQEINFDYWIDNNKGKKSAKELLISNLGIPPAFYNVKTS